uniref:Putative ovule protein n=1 Tax=Solanum chacoense TaxID=4108 RepID=A0A0V0H6G7_SOLCH
MVSYMFYLIWTCTEYLISSLQKSNLFLFPFLSFFYFFVFYNLHARISFSVHRVATYDKLNCTL